MSFAILFLSLIVACFSKSSPIITSSQNKTPAFSNNSSAVGESHVTRPSINDDGSKTSSCDDPKGYSVEEGIEPRTHSVKIVRGGTVLHTIKLLTDEERNGFGFNGAKKTKEGFEISIEYGSRIYYGKRFIFICKHHKFYLSKISVESFDRHNPESWNKKVIRVRPNVPLEKFLITDFMLEGVVGRCVSNPHEWGTSACSPFSTMNSRIWLRTHPLPRGGTDCSPTAMRGFEKSLS